MGWVKTKEELDKYFKLRVREFIGAKMLGVMIETRPELIKSLLPPPLEPAKEPQALIFIAEYPQTNLGPGYSEAALFIRCQYQDEEGNYCLSMPVDAEARMHNGRNIYGFPKKMAIIHLERKDQEIFGWAERGGIRFVEIKAELSGTLPELPKLGPTFLFKAMPAVDITPGFDGPVFLIRQQTEIEMKKLEIGSAEVILRESKHDPWAEIKVEKVIVAYYLVSNNRMQPGKVVAEVDPEAYLPHSFVNTDFFSGE